MRIKDKDLLKEGKVLIDFGSALCGSCKVLKPIVEQFADLTKDVNVYFCNIDEDFEMAAAFGIRSIPTLIYLNNNEIKDRKIGVISITEIKQMTSS